MSQVRLPDGFLDELKARLRPSEVIGRKVKLVRRGKEWVGLSPFTAEKTPSFYVNDAKGIFKDFSSGLGGDVITFLQETERLTFMEAIERLAEQAGLALPQASPEEAAAYDHLARLRAVCAAANTFFQKALLAEGGAAARSYLQDKRRLAPDAWDRWGLGYAPDDWRALRSHLLKHGFSDDELIEAGLVKRSDKGGEPYDVFRNRIMFPIADARGETIAFGGRALSPDDKAKYLNSPETPLFHKSSVLYNFRKARAALAYGERGGLIVCEGYMDVIALGEAGFEQAVAPLGTALTANQLTLLWKAGPDPVLCFDGDAAGRRAADKAVDVALPHVLPDRSVFFCFLPDGQDPDDLLGKPDGRQLLSGLLGQPTPLIEVVWRRERDRDPLDTPERQVGLESRLKAAAETIQEPAVRAAYARDLARRARDHFWEMRAARRGRPAVGAAVSATRFEPKVPGFLVRAACSPALVERHAELLANTDFGHPQSNAICDAIIDTYCDTQTVSREAVSQRLHAAGEVGQGAKIAFDNYADVQSIALDSPHEKTWVLVMSRFIKTPEDALPDGAEDQEAYYRRDDVMLAKHREVAEKQRLRVESSAAAMAEHEAPHHAATETPQSGPLG